MFGPNDLTLSDEKERNRLYDWGFRGQTPHQRVLSQDTLHYDLLLQEAEDYRRARRLQHGPSMGSVAWSRVRDWLAEVGCRVRRSSLRTPCAEATAPQ
jgi:hypothetical protein